jgi:hypothetical protein
LADNFSVDAAEFVIQSCRHRNTMKIAATSLAVLLLGAFVTAHGSQSARPRAARSVHLHYPAPEASVFYNEVCVQKSQPNSFFMSCGFATGYFGIQELRNGKKIVLFSVWEPGNHMVANRVPVADRVEALAKGTGVTITRFGGEGTGGKSFFEYPWKIGETYKFLVTARSAGANKSVYEGYFFLNGLQQWKHVATFRTITENQLLTSLHSFIEDFRRDGVSPTQTRRAAYGNGWVKTKQGRWSELTKALFTADATKLDNINAGIESSAFFLVTGGAVKNTTPLDSRLTRTSSPNKPAALAVQLPAVQPISSQR